MFTCKVFSIFDSKADAFLQPFFSPTSATAIRSFERSVQDEATDFHRYAGDYTLFEIGIWDQSEGTWISHEAKINLGVGSQFLERRPGPEDSRDEYQKRALREAS